MPSTRAQPERGGEPGHRGRHEDLRADRGGREPGALIERQRERAAQIGQSDRWSGGCRNSPGMRRAARRRPRTADSARRRRARPGRDRGRHFPPIGDRLAGVDAGDDRHAGQQPLEQWLALVELDPDRNPLHHLGEIAGGVVGRQQRELRSARRRDALDHAAQRLATGERIHGDR